MDAFWDIPATCTKDFWELRFVKGMSFETFLSRTLKVFENENWKLRIENWDLSKKCLWEREECPPGMSFLFWHAQTSFENRDLSKECLWDIPLTSSTGFWELRIENWELRIENRELRIEDWDLSKECLLRPSSHVFWRFLRMRIENWELRIENWELRIEICQRNVFETFLSLPQQVFEDWELRIAMGWLRSVGSINLQVSFAEYRLFYRALLQKRTIILSILLTKATP